MSKTSRDVDALFKGMKVNLPKKDETAAAPAPEPAKAEPAEVEQAVEAAKPAAKRATKGRATRVATETEDTERVTICMSAELRERLDDEVRARRRAGELSESGRKLSVSDIVRQAIQQYLGE